MSKQNIYRLFRLTNGDNLVAKIHRSTDDKYYLERPMRITSIIADDPINPTSMFKRELVYLVPWIEHTNDNVVPIKKSVVVSMCVADTEISTAYDIQKEREDVGGMGEESSDAPFPEQPPEQPTHPNNKDIDELLGNIMFEDGEFIPENKNITDMSIKDIVNNILNDIVANAHQPPEEEWDENAIDKTRDDYGCHLEDWSPYIEDYTKEPPPHTEDDTKKDS